MPPARLKYQKASGTTLRPRRSLASHCTRKRMEKSACPARPRASHIDSVDIGARLPGDSRAPPSALEPDHARHVDEAHPQSISDPVLRPAGEEIGRAHV